MATGTLTFSLIAAPANAPRPSSSSTTTTPTSTSLVTAKRQLSGFKQHLGRGLLSKPGDSSSLSLSSSSSFTSQQQQQQQQATANREARIDRRPLVISGPSGVGKGTLYNLLFERHPDMFCLAVSHTTRSPRPGEVDGKHYHFVSMAEFEALIEADGFVEHARFGGNRYGTSKGTIEEQTRKGRIVLLDIEMEGVKQIKRSSMAARYVFIAPPSLEQLEARLRGRGTESEASVQKRLAQANNELEYSHTPDVHDLIIVNDDLEAAYRELEQFIFKPLDL